MSMYALRDGAYFGRLPGGRVRLLVFPRDHVPGEFPAVDRAYPDSIVDLTFDDGHWGSLVCAVSAAGEAGGRWQRAMDFHHGRDGGLAYGDYVVTAEYVDAGINFEPGVSPHVFVDLEKE